MSDNCTWTLEHLDDHVDGALAADDARRVTFHLASCPTCAAVEAETRALLVAASSLPRDVLPGHDLWAGIEQQIAPARPTWTWTSARLAVAAVALVALTSAATTAWLSRGASEVPAMANGPDVIPAGTPTVEAPAWRDDMEAAMAQLTGALDTRRAEMDPAALRIIDENLAIIDAAIAEIDQALAAQPENQHLRDTLLAVHRQKIQLLVNATHLPS